MVVEPGPSRPPSTGSPGTGRRLPEPAGHVGAHAWVGKRVREDVRDGVAVAAFSCVTSTVAAALLLLILRFAG